MKFLMMALFTMSTSFAQFKAPQVPPQNQGQCIKSACQILGSFGCRSDYELRRIEDACTRQIDLNCIDNSLNKLSRFEFDDANELTEIIKSCQYVYSLAPSFAATFLSKFDLDDRHEVVALNNSTWLADPRCVKDATSRLSRFDKDDLHEVTAITSHCTGTYDRECFQRACPTQSRSSCDNTDEVRRALNYCVSGPSRQDRRRL
ncbi:hypothetical protein [Bacteriovorax sp. Seq25_V]|uniref:hypothetical protein n=1 Tax=Bacteriovorax sp. Seq25_V TaxID=1201288 RepID=UPI000389EE3B|nr:hypothetical protein [Bacteriovorax sp. Seq25_V]EQC46119.1 hypothetical protein M900_1800 [Bacteriovorax sp. Seq25_V]